MSQRNAALSAVGAAKVVPGALVTPPHSSAAALSSSSYFSFPLSPAMPLTACHVHLFYATSSIPTFVFQPLLLLYLPNSSSYLHSAAARKNKNCLRMRVDKYRHISRGKGQLDNIARSVFSAANTRPLPGHPTAPTNCSMRVALTVENTGL